jgi:hypothetical protein
MEQGLDVIKDFDIFFYYGQNDLEIETKSDVLSNVIQPKRSYFYGRSKGSAGAGNYENTPMGLALLINLPYDIVKSLSKRNQVVSNGDKNTIDRRVAVSQSSIKIDSKNGNTDVTVLYIPYADMKQSDVKIEL